MKKLFLLIFVFIQYPFFGQIIVPNNSFENWTSQELWGDPVPFSTMNAISYLMTGQASTSQTANVHGGNFAAHLQATTNGSDMVEGAIYLGVPGSTGFDQTIPFNGRPDSLIFWVDYNVMAGDQATIVVTFYNGSALIGNYQSMITGASEGFFRFSGPIQWLNSDLPTGLGFAAFSTMENNVNTGSSLTLDDISFIYNNGNGDQFPGGDFELWTSNSEERPDDWTTSNMLTSPNLSVVMDQFGHTGVCAKISSQPNFLNPGENSGYVVTRNLPSQDCGAGEIAIGNQIPQVISGYYQYHNIKGANDSASVYLAYEYYDAVNSNCEIPFEMVWHLPEATDWTYFEFEIGQAAFDMLCGLSDDGYLMVGFISTVLTPDGDILPEAPIGNELFIDDIQITGDVCTSVEQIEPRLFACYPVPADDQLNIQTYTGLPYGYVLTDASGRLVMSGTTSLSCSTMNTLELVSGVYHLRLIGNNGTLENKTIIIDHH